MAAVPMKSEYGPTLGQLLAPRWHGASRLARAVVIGLGVGLIALAAAIALRLQSASYSQGGKVPFSFRYKELYRAPADPGAYVKVQSRDDDGALRYSYEVYPLTLPPYTGAVSGALPRYASGYIAQLSAASKSFELRGEGKTRVNAVPGYQVLYTVRIAGREVYGRNVLLLPPREGVRQGVEIVMLTAATASAEVKAPSEVASTGVLLRPLKTFTFE
jgi:hypothetical protein